jgi:hypothetical protein
MKNWPGANEESYGHYVMIADVFLEHTSSTSKFLTK